MSVFAINGVIGRTYRLFVFFFFMSCTLGAQNFYFDQYSVSEGLAQSTVYSIIQDRDDTYWLGTQAGVSTFDGVEFRNYTAEDGLSEGGVRAVFEDSSGNLWFGHDGGGVSRYTGQYFEVFETAEQFVKSNVTSILEDEEGKVWITSQESGTAMIFDPNASIESLKYEMFMGRRLSDRVFGSYKSADGSLFFITDPVVKKFNRDSSRFETLHLQGMPRYFATTSILEDSKGKFWFGTYHGGLYLYDEEIGDTEMFDLIKMGMKSNWVSTLFEDSNANVWVGTWGGGVARLGSEGEFQIYDSSNGMPGNKIWQVNEDSEGNILIATNENGLCAFKGEYFVSWFEDDGLINSQVFAIEESQDHQYWIGTNQGVSILSWEGNQSVIKDFHKVQGERVRFLVEDKNGSMWIGAEGEGVFTWSKKGNFHFEPRINSNIPHGQITGMDVDSENNLWIGTLDGLIYYEIDQRKINKLSQVSGLIGSEVSSVFVDSKDRVWVGINGKGLSCIVGSDFLRPKIEMSITPTCFAEDKQGRIWIGTEGRGVLAYDPEMDKLVRQLSVQNGLLANLINLLNVDENNNIYIGTNKGLNKYIQENNSIYSYISKSGFVGIEAKQNATLLDKDGMLWFGTGKGVTRYNPKLPAQTIQEPSTHISNLKVNYQNFPMEEGMALSHNQNSLIFDYKCITLNPDAVQYQIMLEGIDLDWRPPSQQTQVNYPALPPKKYTFYLKAMNSDGVWNDPPISLHFQIKPPFYLRWWFILSCIVALAAIIFFYIKVRERALLRENRILEEKVVDRTAEVVAQKEELAQKNKDITDSIKYAKRIQFALLPPKSPFPDTFILFKPKDIVSGDFYWFAEVGGKEFIAAVDCTGHGVPGALVSMIGHSSLNKIVNQHGITDPGSILTELNKEVVDTLHHSREQSDVADGMDLALIAFDKETSLIEFAGAYNPMYLIRNGELLETKADRQAIGRTEGVEKKDFRTVKVPVEKGDVIYLFSDGYADQFGGEQLKKFKSKNMKELMVSIAREPIDKQREILDKSIEKWRGSIEQIDDILIIGRRF